MAVDPAPDASRRRSTRPWAAAWKRTPRGSCSASSTRTSPSPCTASWPSAPVAADGRAQGRLALRRDLRGRRRSSTSSRRRRLRRRRPRRAWPEMASTPAPRRRGRSTRSLASSGAPSFSAARLVPGREVVQFSPRSPAGVAVGLAHAPRRRGWLTRSRAASGWRSEDRTPSRSEAGTRSSSLRGTPHNALDLGPETGQMLSTYIVEVDQPLATAERAPLVGVETAGAAASTPRELADPPDRRERSRRLGSSGRRGRRALSWSRRHPEGATCRAGGSGRGAPAAGPEHGQLGQSTRGNSQAGPAAGARLRGARVAS